MLGVVPAPGGGENATNSPDEGIVIFFALGKLKAQQVRLGPFRRKVGRLAVEAEGRRGRLETGEISRRHHQTIRVGGGEINL